MFPFDVVAEMRGKPGGAATRKLQAHGLGEQTAPPPGAVAVPAGQAVPGMMVHWPVEVLQQAVGCATAAAAHARRASSPQETWVQPRMVVFSECLGDRLCESENRNALERRITRYRPTVVV